MQWEANYKRKECLHAKPRVRPSIRRLKYQILVDWTASGVQVYYRTPTENLINEMQSYMQHNQARANPRIMVEAVRLRNGPNGICAQSEGGNGIRRPGERVGRAASTHAEC